MFRAEGAKYDEFVRAITTRTKGCDEAPHCVYICALPNQGVVIWYYCILCGVYQIEKRVKGQTNDSIGTRLVLISTGAVICLGHVQVASICFGCNSVYFVFGD